MPRKKVLKHCQCGAEDCTETTYRQFAPGHDRKLEAAIIEACGGSILEVKAVVEAALGEKIRFRLESRDTQPLVWTKGMKAGFASMGAKQKEQFSWLAHSPDGAVITAEIDHIDPKSVSYNHAEGVYTKRVVSLSKEAGDSPTTIRHAQELYDAIKHSLDTGELCRLLLLRGTKYGTTKGGVKSAHDGTYWKVLSLSGTVADGYEFQMKRMS
jgi:hypothetical protein